MFFVRRFVDIKKVVGALLGVSLGVLLATGAHAEPCPAVDCKGLSPAVCLEKHKELNKAQLSESMKVDSLPMSAAVLSSDGLSTAMDMETAVKAGQRRVAELEANAASLAQTKPDEARSAAGQSTVAACDTAVKFKALKELIEKAPGARKLPVDPPKTEKKEDDPQVTPAEPGPASSDKKTFCLEKCQSPSSFCIDVDSGRPFCDGVEVTDKSFDEPRSLREGQTWTVRVVGLPGSGAEIELKIGEIKTTDRLTREGSKKERAGIVTVPGPEVLKEIAYTVPSTLDVAAVEVLFSRKGEKAVSERYEVPVAHGKYYVDIGVLIPIVPDGRREIVQTLIPGTGGERRLSVREDWQVEAAVALNVFPCGRRRALWSAFQQISGDTLCDLFGLQVGVDLDFKNAFQRIYAGVTLEPVAGLGAGFGVAIVRGQFLPPGYADGMVIPRGETFTPQTEYMVRPYIGITLSTDILTSLSTTGSAIKSKF